MVPNTHLDNFKRAIIVSLESIMIDNALPTLELSITED